MFNEHIFQSRVILDCLEWEFFMSKLLLHPYVDLDLVLSFWHSLDIGRRCRSAPLLSHRSFSSNLGRRWLWANSPQGRATQWALTFCWALDRVGKGRIGIVFWILVDKQGDRSPFHMQFCPAVGEAALFACQDRDVLRAFLQEQLSAWDAVGMQAKGILGCGYV